MKKIKSVTLLKDLPGVKCQTKFGSATGSSVNDGNEFIFGADESSYVFQTEYILKHPDWFKVEYEEDIPIKMVLTTQEKLPGFQPFIVFTWEFKNGMAAAEAGDYLQTKLDEYLKTRVEE